MTKYEIPPCNGRAIKILKNQIFEIVDICGGQVADFFAEVEGSHDEYVSPGVTIDCNGTLQLCERSLIYSNKYNQMFRIEKDDVRVHDLLFPACSKYMYNFFYRNGEAHQNCLDNLNNALGINRDIIQPINFFMNTSVDSAGKVHIEKPLSKAGDRIRLKALVDCTVAISACSVSESKTNSGGCTGLEVVVY